MNEIKNILKEKPIVLPRYLFNYYLRLGITPEELIILIFIMDKGNTLCYDVVSGRYFESSIDTIKRAVNNVNYNLTHGVMEYISLNEFYDEIGLPHTSIGDELGWNIGFDGQLDVELYTKFSDDERPCVALDYRVAPHYDYAKLM